MGAFLSKLGDFGLGIANSLAGGLVDSIFGGLSMNKQKDISKELMKYQSDLQMKNQRFLLQNQIPFQVSAMKAAGLNPATGEGVSSGTLSSPMPSASGGMYSPSHFDPLQSMQAVKNLSQQQANIELTQSQKDYYDNLSRKTKGESDLIDANLMTYFERAKAEIFNIIQQGYNYKSGTILNESYIKKVDSEIEQIMANIGKIQSEVIVNNSVADLNKQQSTYYNKYVTSQINNLNAQARYMLGKNFREDELLSPQKFLLNSQGSMLRSQKSLNDVSRELNDWALYMSKKYGNADKWFGYVNSSLNTVISGIQAVKGFSIAPVNVNSTSRKGLDVLMPE